jgi:hypothetical protein
VPSFPKSPEFTPALFATSVTRLLSATLLRLTASLPLSHTLKMMRRSVALLICIPK